MSAQDTVEKTDISRRTIKVAASELQAQINALPRLLTESLTLEVTGELDTAVEVKNFYGSGYLTIVAGSGGFTLRNKMQVSACSVFVYIKNIEFQERAGMTSNDALLHIDNCGNIHVSQCGFTGLDEAGRCTGALATYGSRVVMGSCRAAGLGVAVHAARSAIISIDGSEPSYQDNKIGAYVWHGGIVMLTYPAPDTLGAPTNEKSGGLIVKSNGTLL